MRIAGEQIPVWGLEGLGGLGMLGRARECWEQKGSCQELF